MLKKTRVRHTKKERSNLILQIMTIVYYRTQNGYITAKEAFRGKCQNGIYSSLCDDAHLQNTISVGMLIKAGFLKLKEDNNGCGKGNKLVKWNDAVPTEKSVEDYDTYFKLIKEDSAYNKTNPEKQENPAPVVAVGEVAKVKVINLAKAEISDLIELAKAVMPDYKGAYPSTKKIVKKYLNALRKNTENNPTPKLQAYVIRNLYNPQTGITSDYDVRNDDTPKCTLVKIKLLVKMGLMKQTKKGANTLVDWIGGEITDQMVEEVCYWGNFFTNYYKKAEEFLAEQAKQATKAAKSAKTIVNTITIEPVAEKVEEKVEESVTKQKFQEAEIIINQDEIMTAKELDDYLLKQTVGDINAMNLNQRTLYLCRAQQRSLQLHLNLSKNIMELLKIIADSIKS